MPASRRSLAVTTAYRSRLFAIRDRVERAAASAWPSIQTLDGTDWPDRMAAILATAQAEAVRVSGAYLTTFLTSELGRRTQGPTLNSRDYSGLARDGRPLRESLRSPLIATLTALKEGKSALEAISFGRNRAVRMVEMDLMNAARTSLRDGMAEDERVRGWQRSVAGTCGACAGDIEVEVSVELPEIPLEVHPNCQCVTVPVVRSVRNLFPLPTGRELFDRLSPVEQDQEFGQETAEKLRTGEIRLHQLVAKNPQAEAPDFITQRPAEAVPSH